jgi:predicted dehydrogenase
MAVDGAGVKSVLESAKLAKEKNVQVLAGYCFRYDPDILEMVKRIRDGAIGDVVAIRANFLTDPAWVRNRLPGDTEMMYQVRNWYNFAWLSGDFLVERTCHSIDKSLMVMDDQVPAFAYGSGGRMRRTGPHASGDLYDTFSTTYEYEDGRAIFAFGSELASGCYQDREEYVMGTKGTAQLMKGIITMPGKEPMKLKKSGGDRFELEHDAFFKAIRSGNVHNDGEIMAKSTMTTILGRLAGITGKRLSWQQALDMELPTKPSAYAWDATPPTLPDEKGRYKVHVAGMGPVYHEIVR